MGVIDSTKFAEKAHKAAEACGVEAARAKQAALSAKDDEERPVILCKMEGAWLGAVTQAWSQFAIKLGGAQTPCHMHAWARDQSLRQITVQPYSENVTEKGFLD